VRRRTKINDGLSQLVYFISLAQPNCIRSVAPAQADVDSARYDVVSKCDAAGQTKIKIGPHPDAYDVVVSFVVEMTA
jgi:hypothetical protein